MSQETKSAAAVSSSELVSRWRQYATDYDALARMGRNAPHDNLRLDAIGHEHRADCLRNCADELEKAIAANSR